MSGSLRSPGTITTGIGNEPATCAIMLINGPGPSGPGLAASPSIEISASLSITSRIWAVGSPSRITRSGVIAAMPLARPDARSSASLAASSPSARIRPATPTQPLLVLVFDGDDAQHHHAAADADGPAAGIIDRAIPFGGVVNDDEAF